MSYGGSILIRGGTLVLSKGLVKADVLIEDGVVSAIGKGLSAQGVDEIIDASGKLVFPGVVDEHVHMREPGLTHKDNFTNGTKAAAAGGVTTVLEMPNTLPPVDSRSVFEEKKRLLEPKAYVDFGLYGVIHDSNADKFEELVDAGAVGFKIFMGPTTGNIPSPNDGTLYEILLKSAKYGITLAFHAENWDLVKYFTSKVKASGRSDPSAHLEARPPICEEDAIRKLMLFSKKTGGRVHVVHMSAAEGIELLKYARYEGLNVTGETCPHYLILSADDYSKYGCLMKVNPPIRERHHQEALWRAVREGIIYALGSDHAPHTREEKSKDVWEAAAGFTSVQTFLPLMLDQALRGKMPLTKISELMSENPARLFGIYPRKGTIAVGSDGDLVIVNPNAETVIRAEDLYAKHPVTPFIGWRLKGKIEYTILRGVIIAANGKVVGGPKGRWISRLQAG
ncbi:MAG: allantoinase AllB [Thermoprotei archaeon]|nr:MAG: allantoinase AllB [Thermoprotei archaeon]